MTKTPARNRGETHHCAKASDAAIEEAKQLHASGVSLAQIARQFGVTKPAVHSWVQGTRRATPATRPSVVPVDIKIQKGIPLPESESERLLAAIRSMDVGDSFLYPTGIHWALQKQLKPLEFVLQRQPEGGVRIWRKK